MPDRADEGVSGKAGAKEKSRAVGALPSSPVQQVAPVPFGATFFPRGEGENFSEVPVRIYHPLQTEPFLNPDLAKLNYI
jgi:hypothetical protein